MPSGLVPNASVRGDVGRQRGAQDCVDRIGPAVPAPARAGSGGSRGRAIRRGTGPAPGAATARVTTRGLRQMTAGVTPDLGDSRRRR